MAAQFAADVSERQPRGVERNRCVDLLGREGLESHLHPCRLDVLGDRRPMNVELSGQFVRSCPRLVALHDASDLPIVELYHSPHGWWRWYLHPWRHDLEPAVCPNRPL